MKSKKSVTADLTVSLVLSHLSSLSETGRFVPKRVLRSFLNGVDHGITLNPSGYQDPFDFFIDYQSVSFCKKLILPGSADTRGPAVAKFLSTEVTCSATNIRFLNLQKCSDSVTWMTLERARGFIRRVLGVFSWDHAVALAAFGPGASVGVKRRDAHRIKKIGHPRPTVTRACRALAEAYKRFDPHFCEATGDLIEVHGSTITTVPKTAKTDRIIAIEPLLNMFFQKGIGAVIRQRLRSVGLDLDDQAYRNRDLSRLGSVDGRLATVDLSSASDCISTELVRYLVPEEWFAAMNMVRSHYFFIDGAWSLFRKFSSMGNGFTFELESLIFLALAWASSSPLQRRINVDIAAFGDDIIIPAASVDTLYGLLGFCGFSVNTEKSFHTGPFRESCGSHWFKGVDVTPFYLRKVVHSTHDIYWYCNSIRRLALRLGRGVYASSLVKESYDLAVKRLSGRLRHIRIPEGVGDDGLMSSFDEAVPQGRSLPRHPNGWCGFIYRAFARTEKSVGHQGIAALVSSLWLMRGTRAREGDILEKSRHEQVGFRLSVQKRFFPGVQWPYVGPWD